LLELLERAAPALVLWIELDRSLVALGRELAVAGPKIRLAEAVVDVP
jgi:hypothetical protein